MFKIELLLRNSNATLLVQRKSEEDANALYEKILAAMTSDFNHALKLTCDRYPKTKIAVLSQEIAAINMSDG